MKQYDLFERIEKQDAIDILNGQIRTCRGCKLHITRKHALSGEGNIDARIMFIALAPGIKEDAQNRMFIGPSGQIFNKLLMASGIDRKLVFMTNLVKCMLPQNRKPEKDEIKACSQFLDREISIIRPEVIVPLGLYATQAILTKFHTESGAAGLSFSKMNGHLVISDRQKIFPLPHPAALLYNPSFESSTIDKYKKLHSYL
ncbi:MAG: uracil-DNA glycosylase [Bacteroidetes bacterium]|nr:uracil-DNA glycosylase [Bacteroidota bacterium]